MSEATPETWRSQMETDSPPSSYAIAAVLDGEAGGWPRVLLMTGLRSLFIMPGLFIAGVRGGRVVAGGMLGSASITGFLFLYYTVQRKLRMSPIRTIGNLR